MLARQTLPMKRGFAAAAAAHKGSLTSVEEKVSRLPNGLTVASVDLEGAVSHLVVSYRAGSRYEQPFEAGLVHTIRNAIGTDSAKFLGTQLLWQTGSAGAQLTASATRDLISVQMSVVRDNTAVALSLLGELAQPAFKPWDIEDQKHTLVVDRAYLQSYEKLLEFLHQAAYRNGSLGNRVFAKKHSIGKINFHQLEAYARSRLVSGEAALVGINVDHSTLLRYASEQFTIAEGHGKQAVASPYKGGEVRHASAGKLAHVAIVGEGAKLADPKAVATQAVLSALIGTGPTTKFSNGAGLGQVAQAVAKASNDRSVGISALNSIHSDSGLIGVYLAADGGSVGGLVKAAVSGLKALSPDGEALKAARRQAHVDALARAECGSNLAADRAAQLLASGQAVSPLEFAKLIDGVSADDVKKAANQLNKKLTIASHGKIENVPYLDEL